MSFRFAGAPPAPLGCACSQGDVRPLTASVPPPKLVSAPQGLLYVNWSSLLRTWQRGQWANVTCLRLCETPPAACEGFVCQTLLRLL